MKYVWILPMHKLLAFSVDSQASFEIKAVFMDKRNSLVVFWGQASKLLISRSYTLSLYFSARWPFNELSKFGNRPNLSCKKVALTLPKGWNYFDLKIFYGKEIQYYFMYTKSGNKINISVDRYSGFFRFVGSKSNPIFTCWRGASRKNHSFCTCCYRPSVHYL